MNRTKIMFSLLLTASFCTPALASPACLLPGDAQDFNIIGLKSTLMVDALTCGLNKNYDSFMIKFQPKILDAQHQMDSYFARAGGLSGQSMEDEFTTQLANSESDAAAAQGAAFCNQATSQFAQAAALGGTPDLVSYALKQNLAAPPGTPSQCPGTPPLTVASAAPPTPKPKPAAKPAARLAATHKPHPAAPPPPPYMVAQTI